MFWLFLKYYPIILKSYTHLSRDHWSTCEGQLSIRIYLNLLSQFICFVCLFALFSFVFDNTTINSNHKIHLIRILQLGILCYFLKMINENSINLFNFECLILLVDFWKRKKKQSRCRKEIYLISGDISLFSVNNDNHKIEYKNIS